MVKARAMCEELLIEMKRTGKFIALPIIDKHWFRRWKVEYQVCCRKPNKNTRSLSERSSGAVEKHVAYYNQAQGLGPVLVQSGHDC